MKLRSVTLALGAIALVACSSDNTTPSTSSSSSGGAAAAATVKLTSGNQFTPGNVTVKVGETVKWVWEGGRHNVVSGTSCSPDGKFNSGAPVTGGSFEFKFTTAGSYPYYCDPHCSGGMVGTVVVQ